VFSPTTVICLVTNDCLVCSLSKPRISATNSNTVKVISSSPNQERENSREGKPGRTWEVFNPHCIFNFLVWGKLEISNVEDGSEDSQNGLLVLPKLQEFHSRLQDERNRESVRITCWPGVCGRSYPHLLKVLLIVNPFNHIAAALVHVSSLNLATR